MEAAAAVFRQVHAPLTIETIDIDRPWAREVLVRTAATGVCHSDLHLIDGNGRFPIGQPYVLGHEGAARRTNQCAAHAAPRAYTQPKTLAVMQNRDSQAVASTVI